MTSRAFHKCACVGFVVVVWVFLLLLVFWLVFLFAFFLIKHGIQNILITRVPQIKLKLRMSGEGIYE